MTLGGEENGFLLIYASQTGQAKAIAEEIAERAEEHELHAQLHCVSLTEKKFWLERESFAVIVTSTTGEGEPPETAAKFWRRLKKKTLPSNHLQHLTYTLLGLGDSNYTNFCNFGKTLNRRLLDLGAQPFYPSDWADDGVGLEVVADPWIDGLFPAIRQHLGLPPEVEITANPLLFGNVDTTQTENKCTAAENYNCQSSESDKNVVRKNASSETNVAENTSVDCTDSSQNVTSTSQLPSETNRLIQAHNTTLADQAQQEDHTNISHSKLESKSDVAQTSSATSNLEVETKEAPGSDAVSICGDNEQRTGNNVHIGKGDQNVGKVVANEQQAGSDVTQSIEVISDVTGIANNSKQEEQLADLFTGALVLTLQADEGDESLVRSVPPLCDASLNVPVCPAKYLRLEVIDETVDTGSLSIQNSVSFPSSSSDICCVPVIQAVRMTAEDSVKRALKISIDIQECGWSYEPGDAIGVICPNNADEVQWLVDRLGLAGEADCACRLDIIKDTKKKNAKLPEYLHPVFTIRHALTTCCDIRSVPKKAVIRALVEHTSDAREARRLQELCSKQGAAQYSAYIRETNLCVIDVLAAFSSCKPPVELLFEHLPRLNARPYSASSCQLVHPGVLEFVFNVVEVTAQNGRAFHRQGLCTGWLNRITQSLQAQSHNSEDGQRTQCSHDTQHIPRIPIFLRSNQYFRAPADLSVSYILIGPGTGVAPFVGFLQDREHRLGTYTGAVGETWLFYGCRHQQKDFLFRNDLERLHSSGVLTHLCVCFSRDEQSTDKPRYVQDNLRIHARQVLNLLLDNEGSRVYVCGDAQGMAKTVHQTFIELLHKHEGMSAKDAEGFMFQLRFNKRYTEDVWT